MDHRNKKVCIDAFEDTLKRIALNGSEAYLLRLECTPDASGRAQDPPCCGGERPHPDVQQIEYVLRHGLCLDMPKVPSPSRGGEIEREQALVVQKMEELCKVQWVPLTS